MSVWLKSHAHGPIWSERENIGSHPERQDALIANIFASPPLPTMIQTLTTYGQFDGQRQAELQKTYAKTQLLSCRS